jgi:hypothetical protein
LLPPNVEHPPRKGAGMSARCSARTAGAALLAALAVSCGSGTSEVSAGNNPAAGTGTLSTVAPAERPGGAPPGMPGSGPAGAGQPGSPPRAGNGGGGRPGGAPPGVEHDIPRTGDDYSDERTWRSAIAEACGAVGQPANCLELEFHVFAQDPGEDDREPVSDPGPKYFTATPRLYDDCDVTQVDPPSKPAIIIPAGTRIRVEIVCQRTDPDTESTSSDVPEPTSDPEPEPQETSDAPTDGSGG